ncbi:MAG: hypothetical protein ACRDSP_15860 [Pseudonocardiaceae bacterium]
MSDPDDRDEQETEPRPLRGLCRTCAGMGIIHVPKFAMLGGVPGTVHTNEACPECNGERFLAGLEPPV